MYDVITVVYLLYLLNIWSSKLVQNVQSQKTEAGKLMKNIICVTAKILDMTVVQSEPSDHLVVTC